MSAVTCGGTAALEVWSGLDQQMAPLGDGDRIYVRCGGQGLRHVRLRLRAQGTTPMFRYDAVLTRERDGVVIARSAPPHTLPFYSIAMPDACESPDLLLIVDPPSGEIGEQPATLGVTVTGTDARALGRQLPVLVDVMHMGCTQ